MGREEEASVTATINNPALFGHLIAMQPNGCGRDANIHQGRPGPSQWQQRLHGTISLWVLLPTI